MRGLPTIHLLSLSVFATYLHGFSGFFRYGLSAGKEIRGAEEI